jgi:hypothetical protein
LRAQANHIMSSSNDLKFDIAHVVLVAEYVILFAVSMYIAARMILNIPVSTYLPKSPQHSASPSTSLSTSTSSWVSYATASPTTHASTSGSTQHQQASSQLWKLTFFALLMIGAVGTSSVSITYHSSINRYQSCVHASSDTRLPSIADACSAWSILYYPNIYL